MAVRVIPSAKYLLQEKCKWEPDAKDGVGVGLNPCTVGGTLTLQRSKDKIIHAGPGVVITHTPAPAVGVESSVLQAGVSVAPAGTWNASYRFNVGKRTLCVEASVAPGGAVGLDPLTGLPDAGVQVLGSLPSVRVCEYDERAPRIPQDVPAIVSASAKNAKDIVKLARAQNERRIACVRGDAKACTESTAAFMMRGESAKQRELLQQSRERAAADGKGYLLGGLGGAKTMREAVSMMLNPTNGCEPMVVRVGRAFMSLTDGGSCTDGESCADAGEGQETPETDGDAESSSSSSSS